MKWRGFQRAKREKDKKTGSLAVHRKKNKTKNETINELLTTIKRMKKISKCDKRHNDE